MSPSFIPLLLSSFLCLCVELVLIRWIPSTIHVVAFFNNLVLIACFLGIGVGMAKPAPFQQAVLQAGRRLLFCVMVLTIVGVAKPSVSLPQGADHGLNEYEYAFSFVTIPLPIMLLAVFALAAWTTIPFGQAVANCFDQFEKLTAYSLNILGSLLGVLGFALMSWLSAPPYVWFGIMFLGLIYLKPHRQHLVSVAIVAICLAVQQWSSTSFFAKQVFWSPYYKVIAQPVIPGEWDKGVALEVNDQFLLSGFDLRNEATLDPDKVNEQARISISRLKSYYRFPFELKPVKSVLILGSGMGNDVASALRCGVEHVTAVEIDPTVLELGKRYHPEKPYSSPKVRIVCNDGRAFLNHTDEKFDIVMFATLDAHGLISTVGNVRLDSFIYTRESIEAAKRCLNPGGLLVLSFGPFREETQYRQYSTVKTVFTQEPLYFIHANGHRTIVAGDLDGLGEKELPSEWKLISHEERRAKMQEYTCASIPATDDWPHLYLRSPSVPREYWSVLGGILLISVLMLMAQFKGGSRLDGRLFFLGAGFLLLETKAVTEFALLIGSTWVVNVMVFSVILLMILAANFVVLKFVKNTPVQFYYLLLFLALLVEYLYPPATWVGTAQSNQIVLGGCYLGVPIFLSALIFATTFRGVQLGSVALAGNILGAVLGGTCEYFSLALGIRALNLLALSMYGLAFVFQFITRRKN
jgi:SAM-dependent methyltransferase